MTAEEHLDRLEVELGLVHRRDSETLLGDLHLAVDSVNHEIAGLDDPTAGSDRQRLTKLIDRLLSVAREVAKAAGANGIEISGGIPHGITVTISWDV